MFAKLFIVIVFSSLVLGCDCPSRTVTSAMAQYSRHVHDALTGAVCHSPDLLFVSGIRIKAFTVQIISTAPRGDL